MFKKETVSAELVALTYGAIVTQVIRNTENLEEANETLEKMYTLGLCSGYNIGLKIVDEFMANNPVCSDFKQVVNSFAKVLLERLQDGLKMFLGVTGQVRDEIYELEKKTKNISFNLVLTENPLLNFVELPHDTKALQYQNIICGAIRGALHTLNLRGKVFVVKDILKGNQNTIIRVEMVKEEIKSDDV